MKRFPINFGGFFSLIHVLSNNAIQFLQFSQNFQICIYTTCNIQQTRNKSTFKRNTKAFASPRVATTPLIFEAITCHTTQPPPCSFLRNFQIPNSVSLAVIKTVLISVVSRAIGVGVGCQLGPERQWL